MNKSFWQKAGPHFAAIGIFLLVSIAFYKPALEGKVLQQSDVTHWKGMARQSQEYREKNGHFPLWTNSTFAGMPAYQISMDNLHPSVPNIYYLHGVFTLYLPKPINIFFLACLMMYFLLMVFRVNPWIGVLGAIGYAYSSFNPVLVAVGHDTQIICMAYAPAVLASLFLLFKKQYLWGTLGLTAFASMIIAVGHMQIVYYTLLVALFAGIAFMVRTVRNGETRHALFTAVLAAISGLAALGMNMVTVGPLNEFTKETMRGGRSELTNTSNSKNKTVGGLDKDYAFSYSYGKTETFTLLVPAIYGGGDYARPLGSDSKFAEKLMDTFHMPEDAALQYANGSIYWGDQPMQAGTVYLGAVICFLFILGMVLLKDWNKWWMLAVSLLAILLAWGRHLEGINYFLFDHLPYYNKFRAPAMALFIPQLIFPLAGALALQQFLFAGLSKEELWKKLKLSGIITGAVLALLVLLYISVDYSGGNDARLKDSFVNGILQQQSQQGQSPSAQVQQQAEETVRNVVSGLRDDRRSLFGKDLLRSIMLIALVFALLWAYAKEKLKKEWALAGIILLSSIDVLQVAHRYLNADSFMEEEQNDSAFIPSAADLQIKQDTSYYRVLDLTSNPFVDSRASYFHNSLGGYSPAKLGLYQDVIDSQLSRNNMQVYDMLNTKYFIQANPANGQPVAQQNPGALGPAWLVKTIVYAQNANEEMRILNHLNPRDSVVVDQRFKSIAAAQPVYDSSASITLQKNSNDTIVYTTQALTPQFAVFSEIYYPKGWNAYLDGQKTDYARVDYLLRGMPVPAGKHTIEFRFEPASYYTGGRISSALDCLFWALLLTGIGVSAWKARRRQNTAV